MGIKGKKSKDSVSTTFFKMVQDNFKKELSL